MSSLNRRVEQLEKARGMTNDVEVYLRDHCSPGFRELLRGHEAELAGRVFADGSMTFEGLQVMYKCIPEEMKTKR
jgi:hypothetical protein